MQAEQDNKKIRLQKFMAEAGIASRRKSEEYINEGRVKVNGKVAVIGTTVDVDFDLVEFDGVKVQLQEEKVVILFNKPRGVICTNDDPEGRETVMDYFKNYPLRLYNVGRLDYDSEGLLVMTNDGDIAYKMMHPKFVVDKTYYVICERALSEDDIKTLTNGVELEDGMTAPSVVEDIRKTRTGKTSFFITIHEGRNRQVRRMMEKIGHEVLQLRRVKIGILSLGTLEVGQWRTLTDDEVIKLKNSLN